MINTAFVKIWNKLVGAVAWNEDYQLASFEYTEEFINMGWELSPLKMPLSSGARIYSFPELRATRDSTYDTFKGLPGLLADMLPDKYGNQLINIWLAREGRAPESMNPVEKLCFIGTRGVGALEFEPSTPKGKGTSYAIEIDSLVDVSRRMLQKRETFVVDLEDDEEKAMIDILKIGTSAGGARPKAVIAYNEKTKEVRSGQARVPKGFEHWLIKLDGVSDAQFGDTHGYGRVEMAYYMMARDCGIEMMECRLLEEKNRAHFMTKRYDRESGNIKHHVQTWCAMSHFDFNDIRSYSYEQLFQTMRALGLYYEAAEQMFRRMVFNVLARNCDDHTKNFSFILRKGNNWQLAPAYDLCHAYRPDSYWVNQHTLSVNGKRSDFDREDLITIAKSMNIKKAKQIIEQINEVILNWNMYADQVNIDTGIKKSIADTLLNL